MKENLVHIDYRYTYVYSITISPLRQAERNTFLTTYTFNINNAQRTSILP